MKKTTLDEVLHAADQIYDVINLDCQLRARVAIKEHVDKIVELCTAEHITNNGQTAKALQMKCKISPEDMMASSEYVRLLNMSKGEVIEIECDKPHYQYMRSLLKKQNPNFRMRTINTCGIRRKIMRIDDGY